MQKKNGLLKAELEKYAKNNKLTKGTKELLYYIFDKLNFTIYLFYYIYII